MARQYEGVRKKPIVRLSFELREEVNELADSLGLSRNAMLEIVVREGLSAVSLNKNIITRQEKAA